MLKKMLVVLGVALCLSSFAEEAIEIEGSAKVDTSYDFAVDPNVELKSGEKDLWIELPVKQTNYNGFSLDFDVEVTRMSHYGRVTIGLENQNAKQKMMVTFTKHDTATVIKFEGVTAGRAIRIPEFKISGKGLYKINITYVAPRRSVRFVVKDSDNKVIHDTGDNRISGRFNFSSFAINVNAKPDGASDVYFDEEKKAIFFCGFVDNPYIIEGLVDNVCLVIDENK